MKNDNAAREDLSKGRKSPAISVAIARKDNDSRSALGEQHLWEPSNIGIGHGVINAGVAARPFGKDRFQARLHIQVALDDRELKLGAILEKNWRSEQSHARAIRLYI